ncbi:hypothetical protein [Clostridium aquiflavi]|uniref:DUF1795 domain-containing protein n=1 Tax=Clostridium aquiflavi TaxID=3073603 RepID=A0ABU1ECE6_9CLOT|nr:hypothetical protein [Clostridium sp. 5N-1]MDR5585848.1 hypothetical protein [Clostridium sp. 5N-1]
MSNIDEKIAKLKLQQRIDKEEEERLKNEPIVNEKEITLEEVCEGIKNGEVIINDKKIIFTKKVFYDGKFELPVPESFFEVKVNTDKNLVLVNNLQGISFNGNYINQCTKKQNFNTIKSAIQKNFKETKIYMEWIEEGKFKLGDSTVFFATYKTPTAKGQLYNLVFLRDYKGTVSIGNYNCFYKDIKEWELLIKASVKLMRFI